MLFMTFPLQTVDLNSPLTVSMMVHPHRPAVKRAKVAKLDRFGYCRRAKRDKSGNRRDVNRPFEKKPVEPFRVPALQWIASVELDVIDSIRLD